MKSSLLGLIILLSCGCGGRPHPGEPVGSSVAPQASKPATSAAREPTVAGSSPVREPANGKAPSVTQAASPAATVARYPVRWSDWVELKSLDAVDAGLRADEPDHFGELALNDERAHPSNCLEFAALHAKGFSPATTVEQQADGGALLRCRTLELLGRARPAGTSYLRELVWDQRLLALLPVEIATALNADEERAVKTASAAGKSLRAFDPKARAKPSRGNTGLEIIEGDGQTTVLVAPEAWGDFDGDGIDDLALSVVNAATHGSYSHVRLLELTRRSPNGALELLK